MLGKSVAEGRPAERLVPLVRVKAERLLRAPDVRVFDAGGRAVGRVAQVYFGHDDAPTEIIVDGEGGTRYRVPAYMALYDLEGERVVLPRPPASVEELIGAAAMLLWQRGGGLTVLLNVAPKDVLLALEDEERIEFVLKCGLRLAVYKGGRALFDVRPVGQDDD